MVLRTSPSLPEAHYQLAVLLVGRKQTAPAIAHYRQALRARPDWPEALNNLAWILATQEDPHFRDGAAAVRLAARAVELTKTNSAGALDTLAAGYAEAGRFAEAAKAAQQAVRLAETAGQKDLAAEARHHVELYQTGQAFRER
jgi:tetratricopeptide (TPR) repeat protein